ncbi:MAG: DNA gyrase inhibitor YacG [Usitatibacter sp.]
MKARQVPCPTCGKAAVFGESNPARPFCSERCRTLDLGGWASESYRIPTRPAEEEGTGNDEEPKT